MEWAAIVGIALAVAGAVTGTISTITNLSEKNSQIDKDKAYVEAKKQRTLDLMDLEFDTAKKTADDNADSADRKSTLAEGAISDTLNGTVEQFGENEKARALQENSAEVSIDQSTGNALSAQASSGTRAGGSAAVSTDLQRAYAEAQLQMQEDVSRSGDAYSLASALDNYAQNRGNLAENRLSAQNLRESYEDGGSQKTLYEKQRANTEADYNAQTSQLEDSRPTAWDWITNITAASFGGASSGWNAGTKIGSFIDNAQPVNYQTKADYSSGYNAFANLDSQFGSGGFYNNDLFSQGMTNNSQWAQYYR